MTPFTSESQRATLEVIRYHLTKRLSERELYFASGNVEAAAWVDLAARDLVAQLEVFLVKGKTTSGGASETVSYPADWWQAFKARWFDYRTLRWLLRKYPVRMTEVKVQTRYEVTRVCPHIPIPQDAARNRRYRVEFLTDGNRF